MFTMVVSCRIKIHHVKRSTWQVFTIAIIWRHHSLGWTWSRHWLTSIMEVNKTRPTICANHKGDWDSTLHEKLFKNLSYDILTNNQYLIPRFAMTCFKISNIDMDNEYYHFTRSKSILISTILKSLMNSEFHL
jgi:hypothetical protein